MRIRSSPGGRGLVAIATGLLLVVGMTPSLEAWSGAVDGRQGMSHICRRWVAPPPTGSDSNTGSATDPWATLTHAAATVPDQGCVVLFAPGVYSGYQEVERRFTRMTTFKSREPYRAILENDGTVVDVDGGRNVTFEGFEMRQTGPESPGFVAIVDRRSGEWSEFITFRDNVIHDSFDNDLLKVHNGVRFMTIEGNVFYNQGPGEQHLDINSVTDVQIRDNIFFNDVGRSGREPGDTKHFIVVKDSNGREDGLIGSRRVAIRRNVFLNWQGGDETYVKIGNDGNPDHEASDVLVENNLVIGNSPQPANTTFGVSGARDVVFSHNTVTGDLPARSYAFIVNTKGDNPPNQNISFVNNIWSDPTGTMGNEFSDGDPAQTITMMLDGNLYWNGGARISDGDPLSPLVHDARRVVGDPGLAVDQSAVVVPYWSGTAFLSGSTSIRQEFVRLVEAYGRIPADSPAVGRGNSTNAPHDDILGRPRNGAADVGAYQISGGIDTPTCPSRLPATIFEDLQGLSREAIDAIACLSFHEIAFGPNRRTFFPFDQVSRWQMALFLTRVSAAAGVQLPDGSDQGFADLRGLDPGTVRAVNQLAQIGITQGTSPETFSPSAAVPRWQMALFLVRTLEVAGIPVPGGEPRFSDLTGLDRESVDSISRLAAMGIARGTTPDTFSPLRDVARWQMTLFLVRTLDAGGVVARQSASIRTTTG